MTHTVTDASGADELSERIRAASLKVTATRRSVLAALSAAPHTSADTIFAAVVTELPGTSLQAVYGVLTAFTAAGLVRRIEPAGSAALYECRIGDNHHHLVCTHCSAVQDVDCVVGGAPCLTPSDTGGFAIHTAEVTFWGLCAACQTGAAEAALAAPASSAAAPTTSAPAPTASAPDAH
ncbi:Fur family transcriptional regulator [Leifsonia sp. YAF41]|uniref:Fur family transcriptional regulator n=1 Tax=Leifsonia sp. YAF41 TaxID=3233086 RepID=UPI003F94FD2C